MKVIIAGSRTFSEYDYKLVEQAVKESGFEIGQIISGRARGADALGERYAREHNIPCRGMPAQWNTYGKSAGYKRNVEMAKVADAAIILWDRKSKGAQHMIITAREHQLQVFVLTIDVSNEEIL